ncbi:hypothetical protein BC941DRAFT_415180 [Chlamydoabsidia padenii]|nr:hypothetical protein BC941DRAFT_415180 [Chlamydoabsidia padenii]
MFQRLIILEADHHSRWIKVVGLLLIAIRFADWPYEIAVHEVMQQKVGEISVYAVGTCWAQWQIGVLILNVIGDVVANLFLSGMFVRRLYKHIRSTQSSTPQNEMIEYIARKSLVCLTLTFFVNLAMNLLKITNFIGEYSDAFTVYFELIESTLLVEALRVDDQLKATVGCSQCGKSLGYIEKRHTQIQSQKRNRMQPFGSFDFVPLEERQSTSGGAFRKTSDNYQSHSTSAYSPTTTNTAADSFTRRATFDDSVGMTRGRSMDITTPGSYSMNTPSFSLNNTSHLPQTSLNPPPSSHQQSSASSRPLNTLSRSLVHDPEWNNDKNDYNRMF